MRIVSEIELKRAVRMSNLFGGMAGAALTGLLMALWLYFWLGMGIGPA